jgi:hypothetical protein
MFQLCIAVLFCLAMSVQSKNLKGDGISDKTLKEDNTRKLSGSGHGVGQKYEYLDDDYTTSFDDDGQDDDLPYTGDDDNMGDDDYDAMEDFTDDFLTG